MTEGINYTSILRTDFKDPPNLITNQKHLLASGKTSVYEILRELDVYYGMADGFSYRSNGRLASTKFKHKRKSVGPTDYFIYPATVNMDYGFWTADPVLKDDKWYVPRSQFRIEESVLTHYLNKCLATDRFFKLRSG
ncbi:uncharacterized protein LOC123688691 [Harmonia axyridis]|uniref:uncharacterized protein LOC123688691 n=1 Tax=Harmonia axyridis TaxID=115357 RepID=UPI001E2774E6|nr:uncharacterized protein LOC123688691 [Harmonia axyridis]